MKILLTSQGFTTDVIKKKFFEIVGKKPSEISIAFIPTAAYPNANKSWVKQTREDLLKTGIKSLVDVDLKKHKDEELYKKLKQFDVIFVNGGNTFSLLYWVKKSGFDKVIKRLLKEGKTYVGLSAGTIIASPTIEVANWKGMDDSNVVKLDNLNSLGLVNFYIFVHYLDKWENLVNQQEIKLDGKLTCLTDQQAVTEEGAIIS